QDIVRRGRNTKSSTMPKNADIIDYRYATGFEALIGYLYLTGQIDRLMEVIRMVINVKTGQQK
ncbi:MAG TPA: Mini-ribonuclease 3, partial [Candidatus Diapherotrites archaeon]|nr:Mini-ribonuclease 3 [Candidatus Diapherotrites archaeon]